MSPTSTSFHDKYNTLPAGSAALYRGMFAASAAGSRSPLSARSASLRLQQQLSQPAEEVLLLLLSSFRNILLLCGQVPYVKSKFI